MLLCCRFDVSLVRCVVALFCCVVVAWVLHCGFGVMVFVRRCCCAVVVFVVLVLSG